MMYPHYIVNGEEGVSVESKQQRVRDRRVSCGMMQEQTIEVVRTAL